MWRVSSPSRSRLRSVAVNIRCEIPWILRFNSENLARGVGLCSSMTMTALGVGRHLRLLGIMELAFAALFVVPATMKLGFILASCYFGGAIATELSHDALKANPFVPIVLLWIGAFVRDRSIFF